MGPIGIIIFLLGLFSIAGGVFNWDWFMNNKKGPAFRKSNRKKQR